MDSVAATGQLTRAGIRVHLRLGRWRECADALRQVLAQMPEATAERSEHLALLADVLATAPAAAEELHGVATELAQLAQRHGQATEWVLAHFHQCVACRRLGLRDEASRHGMQALQAARALGDAALQAQALLRLADLPLDEDNHAEARRLLEECLAMARQAGDTEWMFWALNNLSHLLGVEAAALAQQGDTAAAQVKIAQLVDMADRALALARASGHVVHEAYALSNLADAHIVNGDEAQARGLIQAYGELARDIGHERLQVYAHLDEVRLLRAAGQVPQALVLLEAPAFAALLAGNGDLEAARLQALYELHKEQGHFEVALACHERLSQQRIAMLQDDAARLQRVLLARLDLEQAQSAAEKAHLEAQAERLRSRALEEERDRHLQAALRDPLTGLGNRRAMDQDWPQHRDRAAREGAHLFAAILDIDHFKAVNDNFGHATGDAVLAEVARLLLDLLRRRDGVYRLGGEEFLVLMTDPSAQAGLGACERLRRGVEAAIWSNLAPDLRVTLSAGLATRQADETIATLLARADAALYQAKRKGRDRCEQA
jgi:diguanylate cyclase (GGDEF)-like protein